MASGVRIPITNLRKNIATLDDKIDRAMAATCQFHAGKIEAHMKLNAPWTDRTTNARNGLRAQHVTSGKFKHDILMTHSVEYGIYLETMQDGRYAILEPTRRIMGPRVMQTFNKLLDRLTAGS